MKNKNAMQILIVTSEFKGVFFQGGMGTYLSELVAGLQAEDCRCLVVLNRFFRGSRLLSTRVVEGCIVIEHDLLSDRHLSLGLCRQQADAAIRNLAGEVKRLEFRPDLIHCNDANNFHAAEQLAAKFDVPLVSSVHSFALTHRLGGPVEMVKHYMAARRGGGGPAGAGVERVVGKRAVVMDELPFILERRMLRRSDHVVFVSHTLRGMAQALYPSYGLAQKSRVVYNGMKERLATHPASDVDLSTLRRFRGNRKIIAFSGRLVPQKGVMDLLRAFAILAAARQDLVLVVVGQEEGDERLFNQGHQFLYAQQLSDRVLFTGSVPREMALAVYEFADVGVVPSLWEPFGYVLLEMMACRLPVVTTAVDGPNEIISDGVDGFKVPVSLDAVTGVRSVDCRALADKIALLLDQPALSKRLADQAYDKVNTRFSLAAMVGQTLQVFDDAIANRRTQANAQTSRLRVVRH